MKILISSHAFHPSVGGIETVTGILADHFLQVGHEVQILTQTPDDGIRRFPYKIYRRPSIGKVLSLMKWADVYLQNNISLQTAWPLLFIRRPWVVAHHVWIRRPDGRSSWQDKLKCGVLRFAENLVISQAIGDALPVPGTLVGDPYQDAFFSLATESEPQRDLVFLGRLVSDKGVAVLLEALKILFNEGQKWNLTIVGEGEERPKLEELTLSYGLASQVEFVGRQVGEELRDLLRNHRLLVVPSLWEEPFGIVALEGIASGCLVIGSEKGGLREAIGPCGLTFPNGNAQGLANAIRRLLTDHELASSCRAAAADHLSKYTCAAVGDKYLQILHNVVERFSTGS